MKKFKVILCTFILVIIFSLCLLKIISSFFTMYLYYDCVMWCGEKEKEIIQQNGNVEGDFNVATVKVNWGRDKSEVFVISELPKGIGNVVKIEQGNYYLSEYIRENNNSKEVVIKIITPYIILCVIDVIIFCKFVFKSLC